MKILVVSNMYPDKRFPSAGIFVKKFCDQLGSSGIKYDLSVMAKHVGMPGKLWGYFSFYVLTFFRLMACHYDIVYVHYASHSSVPVLWARRWRQFVIYTNLHGGDVIPVTKGQKRFHRYTEKVLALSEKVIVPSQYFKDYAAKKYGLAEDSVFVYPSGGIDRNIFYPCGDEAKATLRRRLKLSPDRKTFLYAGRITQGKGWDVFLKAVCRLEDMGYQGNYVVAGDGEEAELYLRMVKERRLEHKIEKFPLLPQEKLAELYNVSDVFVFPTMLEESLGLVAIEAMACGCPVIGSNYAALKYYIKNGVNGFRFAVGNDRELAERMAGFIEGRYPDKQLRDGALATAAEYDSAAAERLLKRIFQM